MKVASCKTNISSAEQQHLEVTLSCLKVSNVSELQTLQDSLHPIMQVDGMFH